MLYAMLCYRSKEVGGGWSDHEDATVMVGSHAVYQSLTDTAHTLMGDPEPPMVLDGPFAETKEQFLGCYRVGAGG